MARRLTDTPGSVAMARATVERNEEATSASWAMCLPSKLMAPSRTEGGGRGEGWCKSGNWGARGGVHGMGLSVKITSVCAVQ